MDEVTGELNSLLQQHAEVGEALALIIKSPLLGRETLSAALGKLSEHLVARLIGGTRKDRGNNGFDLLGPGGERIEVKSRQLSKWGEKLMFDFSRHTASASQAYCIAWHDRVSPPAVHAAFRGTVTEFVERWGARASSSYSIRTDFGRLRAALKRPDVPWII